MSKQDCVHGIEKELIRLRRLKRLSVRQAAMQAGVKPSVLESVEDGRIVPSPDELQRLADFYQVDYARLMVLAGHTADGHRNLLASVEMTEEEAKELLDYLEYLRWRKAKRG